MQLHGRQLEESRDWAKNDEGTQIQLIRADLFTSA
jgi:hypothetical protein